MAAWQVEFSIVPRRAIAALGLPSQQGSKEIGSWAGSALPSDYQRKLAAVASPASSSNADLQSWGTEDGNRVEVWSVDGRATMIAARVDVRRLDSKFGAMLLQFVRTADAVLVRSDGLVVQPLVGAFAAALRSSSAWRFANDPAKFLATYNEPERDDE
jgi:hypothetical protein